MKNAWGVHWKMVCAPLFIVIHYSFVEHAAPTFLIMTICLVRRASRTILNTFKIVCGTWCINVHIRRTPEGRWIYAGSDGPMPDTRNTCRALARYSLYVRRLRCSKHPWRRRTPPPYLWCNWWQAHQLQVSLKQRFHILGPTTVTTAKGSTPLSLWHS